MASRFMPGALLLALALAGCRTAGPSGATPAAPPLRPSVSARALMEACWPEPGPSPQRVKLTFIKQGGRLADVMFEALEGAPNPVGRCLQQLAWRYPWEGELPDALELAPPPSLPSGWVYLAYVALLDEGSYAPDRGVLRPGPLVRACLERGRYRRDLRFVVRTQPVSVSVRARAGAGRPEEDRAVTDAERCAEAVLAATVYPGTRPFELSFPDFSGAPPAAPASEVAAYFPPPGAEEVGGALDPFAAKERLAERQPAVSACWEAALARRSALAGARTLRIRVAPGGEVAFSLVIANQSDSRDEAADYLLDRCLVGALEGLRFPPPGGRGAELAYSWVFAHR